MWACCKDRVASWKVGRRSIVLTELPSQPGLWLLLTGPLLVPGHNYLCGPVDTERGRLGLCSSFLQGGYLLAGKGATKSSQQTSAGQSRPGTILLKWTVRVHFRTTSTMLPRKAKPSTWALEPSHLLQPLSSQPPLQHRQFPSPCRSFPVARQHPLCLSLFPLTAKTSQKGCVYMASTSSPLKSSLNPCCATYSWLPDLRE